jgi:hypothetical protein
MVTVSIGEGVGEEGGHGSTIFLGSWDEIHDYHTDITIVIESGHSLRDLFQ